MATPGDVSTQDRQTLGDLAGELLEQIHSTLETRRAKKVARAQEKNQERQGERRPIEERPEEPFFDIFLGERTLCNTNSSRRRSPCR